MRDETKMMLAFLHSECNRGGCDTCPFNTITETEFCPLEDTEGVEKAFKAWMEMQEGKEGAE